MDCFPPSSLPKRTKRMIRLPRLTLPAVAMLACLAVGNLALAKSGSEAGPLKSLQVEQAAAGKSIVLRGRDARQQLCVTGVPKSGPLRDLTRSVQYDAEPAGIVAIDPSGLVTPLADGTTRLRITSAD